MKDLKNSMIQSHPDSVIVEGNGGKKNRFDLIANIFKKKSTESDNSLDSQKDNTNCSEIKSSINNSSPLSSPSATKKSMPDRPVSKINTDTLSCASEEKSPVTNRVRNLTEDMAALHLSRQDNPYLQQHIERLSLQDTRLSNSCEQMSPKRHVQGKVTSHSDLELNRDLDKNLHQHLIRSPPPQFPQNLSHFMLLTWANSPVHQHKENTISSENDLCKTFSKSQKTMKSMNSGSDVHDAKSLRQQWGHSQGSSGSGPNGEKGLPSVSQGYLNSSKPYSVRSSSTESRPVAFSTQATTVNTVTGSLPGLPTCYLGLYTNGEIDRYPDLGPIKHQDGLLISSSVQDLTYTSNYGRESSSRNLGNMFSSNVTKTGSREPLLHASKASSIDSG